jgi:hypothetical protein
MIVKEDIQVIYTKLGSQQIVDSGLAAIFFAILAVSSLLIPPNHGIFADIGIKYREPELSSSFYSLSLYFANSSSNMMGERKGKFQDIIVALGLLSMYLAAIGGQAEAWIMVGRAIRHAQDLGFHVSLPIYLIRTILIPR